MKDTGRQKDRQRWERKEWASLVEKHPRRVKASPWGLSTVRHQSLNICTDEYSIHHLDGTVTVTIFRLKKRTLSTPLSLLQTGPPNTQMHSADLPHHLHKEMPGKACSDQRLKLWEPVLQWTEDFALLTRKKIQHD